VSVIAVQRALSQLNYLKQYVERFETFHAANSKKEIREFMDFFSQDDVIGHVSRALFERMSMSAAAWHAEVQAGSKILPLPDDPVECFAFRLGTLRLCRRNKLDLRFFVANHFSGSHLNEMLMNWKRLIVHPFAADCRRFADAAVAALPESEWVDFEPHIHTVLDGAFRKTAFGPRAWTDADEKAEEAAEAKSNPAPAAANPSTTPTLASALDSLEAAVRSYLLRAAARKGVGDDLLRDVQALRLETQRRVPMRPRTLARLAAIASHPQLTKACKDLEVLL
jgi:hypothetical protein